MNPRPITQIHEIELSSNCNLACVYCPNPKMKRWKGEMDWVTYERALDHVAHFCREGTQEELALTGVGEALLHPEFARAVLYARGTIGHQRLLTFSTNGILITDELLEAIAPAKPVVFVSLHRPEVAGPAIERVKKHGLQLGTNVAFATGPLNWVGTVDWPANHHKITCEYLRSGWAVVRADGTVGSCCWDAESVSGRLGHVSDPFGSWVTAPHEACKSCSLTIPE